MDFFRYDTGVFEIEGAISLEHSEDTVRPWRFPYKDKAFFPELDKNFSSSGVRITFETDAAEIALLLKKPAADQRVDLCMDGKLIQSCTNSGEDGLFTFAALPAGFKRIALWLDTRHTSRIVSVGITPGAKIRKSADIRKKWIHYGSSISQCNQAHSPSQTWAALASEELGLNLTNLGFNGRCILAPMIGRLIRDTPADLITMKLGINIHGSVGMGVYIANAIGLVVLVREKHPDTPLVLISPVFSTHRETQRQFENGTTLVEMRAALSDVVDRFAANGDKNIHYLDGLSIFGHDDIHMLPDNLHPNGDAQPFMAARISSFLKILI